MVIMLYDKLKELPTKKKLHRYRLYNSTAFLLHQDIIKEMTHALEEIMPDHTFMIEINDNGKYVRIEDWIPINGEEIHIKDWVSFGDENDLELQSITREVTQCYQADINRIDPPQDDGMLTILFEMKRRK